MNFRNASPSRVRCPSVSCAHRFLRGASVVAGCFSAMSDAARPSTVNEAQSLTTIAALNSRPPKLNREATTSRPMKNAPHTRTEKVQLLNDSFRRTFVGGSVMITAHVQALRPDERCALLHKVRQFDDFEVGGDPYGEHDFGAIDLAGTRFFWKIDYYNGELDGGSVDPSDPAKTARVLTIMAASEY